MSERRRAGGQIQVEHLDGEKLRRGRFLLDGRRDGRAVPEAVHVVSGCDAARVDHYASGDAIDVRVLRVDAAVHYGDSDTVTPSVAEPRVAEPE